MVFSWYELVDEFDQVPTKFLIFDYLFVFVFMVTLIIADDNQRFPEWKILWKEGNCESRIELKLVFLFKFRLRLSRYDYVYVLDLCNIFGLIYSIDHTALCIVFTLRLYYKIVSFFTWYHVIDECIHFVFLFLFKYQRNWKREKRSNWRL